MQINTEVLLSLGNDTVSYSYTYLHYKLLSEWLHKGSKLYSALYSHNRSNTIGAWNAGKILSGIFTLRTSAEECLKDLMTNTLLFWEWQDGWLHRLFMFYDQELLKFNTISNMYYEDIWAKPFSYMMTATCSASFKEQLVFTAIAMSSHFLIKKPLRLSVIIGF